MQLIVRNGQRNRYYTKVKKKLKNGEQSQKISNLTLKANETEAPNERPRQQLKEDAAV